MDRGAWWATVHRVTKSQTRLSISLCVYSLDDLLLIFVVVAQVNFQNIFFKIVISITA